MQYVIHKVHTRAKATGENLYVGKLGVNKAFDNTDLDLVETAAEHYTDKDMAAALLAEHREGKLTIIVPGGPRRSTRSSAEESTKGRQAAHSRRQTTTQVDVGGQAGRRCRRCGRGPRT